MGKKILIVILDADEDYIIGVNEYLREYNNDNYLLYTFSDINRFKEFYAKNDNIDIFVVGESLYNKDILDFVNSYVEILTEEKDVVKVQGYDTVYKYQKMALLISTVLNNYAEKNIDECESILVKEREVNIIAVYSPINRCGKSTLCLEIAKEIKGENPLVIILEEFSNIINNIESELNISDLLYYYLRGNSHFDIKLEAIIEEYEGISIIPPIKNISDIAEVQSEIWTELILKICDVGKYTTIIIDISNMVGDIFKFLKICNYVFIPYLDDEYSEIKMAVFDRYIELYHNNIKNTIIHKINVSNVLNNGYDYVVKEIISVIRGNISDKHR